MWKTSDWQCRVNEPKLKNKIRTALSLMIITPNGSSSNRERNSGKHHQNQDHQDHHFDYSMEIKDQAL